MTTTDDELRDRLAAMESRLGTAEPPALPTRHGPRLALSLVAGPLLVLAVVATAAAGIVVANQAHGYPGVENPGQPLAGAHMECMTPPEAAAFLTAHGFTNVVWQVESDAPTAAGAIKPGSKTVQQTTAPETGIVVPGSIVDDGTLLMVVDQRRSAQIAGSCEAR